MLTPKTGFYPSPVVTLDFSSLYPSCMMEFNICASTRLSRADAAAQGLPFLVPPAPALTGRWTCGGATVAVVDEKADDDIRFTHRGCTLAGRYGNELNTHVALDDGRVGELLDGGYAIAWADGTTWRRPDADVLVMVDPSAREGVIPKIERTLKLDRKAAKKKLAAAEAAGDAGGVAFFDNLQNALKVIMNALYGGLGSGKGGIFPESAPLASAITARGRSLICEVKQRVEQRFWLTPDGLCGGFADEERPAAAEALEVLYGDSVTGDTPVLVKVDGVVSVRAIACLSSTWEDYEGFKPGEEGPTDKQQSALQGVQAWTSTGWAPVVRVIRHRCRKRIFRVTTRTGLVDVTEDHSLLSPAGELLKPGGLSPGVPLMHGYPSDLLSGVDTVSDEQAFLYGVFMGCGTCGGSSWSIRFLEADLLHSCRELLQIVHPGAVFYVGRSHGAYSLSAIGCVGDSRYGGPSVLADQYQRECFEGGRKRVPPCIFASQRTVKAFLDGLWASGGCREHMDVATQTAAGWCYMLLRAMDWDVGVAALDVGFRLTWSASLPGSGADAVQTVSVLHDSHDDFVFDLETRTGNFQAGAGQMLVKNTDSVMIHFPGCSLQQAATHGAALSAWFGQRVLRPPHVLEFEKVLFPCAFYKKKMYCANKYEGDYSTAAKGKIFARGLSAVRRDNALVVKQTVTAAMDMLFKQRLGRDAVVDHCSSVLAAVHNSAVLVHEGAEKDFDGRLPFSAFVQSAGISKNLDDYATDNTATAIARQILDLDPQSCVGKSSRVTFVVTLLPGAKRCQQALLPATCLERRVHLDPEFYTSALVKKLAPLLSVLFSDEERAAGRVTTAFNAVVDLPPASKSAQTRLLGEARAERALLAGVRRFKLYAPRAEIRQAPDPLPRPEKKRKTLKADEGQRTVDTFFAKI